MIEARLAKDGEWVICAGDCGFRLAKVMKDEEGTPRQLGLREGFVPDSEGVWGMSPRTWERYRAGRSVWRRGLASNPGVVSIRTPPRSIHRAEKHMAQETVFSRRLVPSSTSGFLVPKSSTTLRLRHLRK